MRREPEGDGEVPRQRTGAVGGLREMTTSLRENGILVEKDRTAAGRTATLGARSYFVKPTTPRSGSLVVPRRIPGLGVKNLTSPTLLPPSIVLKKSLPSSPDQAAVLKTIN